MTTTVTKTVKSAGGDYSTLAAFEAGEQADIVSSDQIKQAECYAQLDDGGDPVFAGWTLNATHYVRVYVATGNEHGCVRGQGYRRRIINFGHGVEIDQDFIRVEGIAVESDDNGGANAPGDRGFHIDCGASADIQISKCYQTVGITNDNAFVRTFNATGGLKIWNCMAGPPDLVLDRVQSINIASDGTCYLYNNTILGNDLGAFEGCIVSSGGTPTIVMKNNICDRGASPDTNAGAYLLSGATTTGSTNNLSDDATAPDSNPIINAFPVYEDETNGDLHITNASVGRGVGLDLRSDGNIPFSDDIDGNARPVGDTWDVGANQTPPPPPRSLIVNASPLRW